MKLFIITGASKGLGQGLLELALGEDHTVISISRTRTISHPKHLHLAMDLSTGKGLEAKLDKMLSRIDLKKITGVHLINNAAIIEPIGEIENFKQDDIEKHIKVNLLTPMILSSWLMRSFSKKKMPITIVNISSGAAFHPIVNWSLYCSSKSGLKMFTDCLMEDFQSRKNFKAFSFSPGVMDTSMQATIRKQTKGTFKNVEKFKKLKQKKLLLSPDKVAQGLYELLRKPEKINQAHYDIREMK